MIGPSGGGKSTALVAIAGFQPLSSGQILWQGRDISKAPPTKRPIAVLFQDKNLFLYLSIELNVANALSHRNSLQQDERIKVSEALGRVGLKAYSAKKPAELSGRQKSCAALALILLQDKPNLLLDEPFSALRYNMLSLVAEIASESKTTVIMVTHTISDARFIAEETFCIDNGKVEPLVWTNELLKIQRLR